jgi:hypothetical protein
MRLLTTVRSYHPGRELARLLLFALSCSVAHSQEAVWKLNTTKSSYKPGPLPIGDLTITVERTSNGITASAAGQQRDGARIFVAYFNPWKGDFEWTTRADASLALAGLYNFMTAPFGSSACSNANPLGMSSCFSTFGSLRDTEADMRINEKAPPPKVPLLPGGSTIHMVQKNGTIIVETIKGSNGGAKFQAILVYDRQ